MRETPDDLETLQRVLDESAAAGGPHLSNIFDESSRVTAAELVAELDGIFEMHLACVTSAGAPLVAPVDGIFFKGNVWVGLPSASVRARLLRRDPRVSASYNENGFAFIVHGTARSVEPDGALAVEFGAVVRELYGARYGPGWAAWHEQQDHSGDFGGWIEPRRFFTRRDR